MQHFIAIRDKIMRKRQHYRVKGDNETIIEKVIEHCQRFRLHTDGVRFECRLCPTAPQSVA